MITRERLVQVGRKYFDSIAPNSTLTDRDLPDGGGVCVIRPVRGGGKIFVAPDETVLYVGSSLDFEAGLKAFKSGKRTAPETFDSNATKG